MKRIALLSDVHGNVTAFQAVLKDIAARQITEIYNLGDVVGKGPCGPECVRLSKENCVVTVRGNWDDLLPRAEDPQRSEDYWWWHRELSEADKAWLLNLPEVHTVELCGRTIRLVHASSLSVHTRVIRDHTEQQSRLWICLPAPK